MKIRFAMLAMGIVLIYGLLCSVTAVNVAQAQQIDHENAQNFAAYKAAGAIGREMFFETYKQEGALIRTAAILEACDQIGLARAVAAKGKDPDFSIAPKKMIHERRFDNLPTYTLLSAQAVANQPGAATFFAR